jgi:hypothetical protein
MGAFHLSIFVIGDGPYFIVTIQVTGTFAQISKYNKKFKTHESSF